jgi:hypothetical protein
MSWYFPAVFFINLALAIVASGSAGARLALGRADSIDGQIASSLLRRALHQVGPMLNHVICSYVRSRLRVVEEIARKQRQP